MYTVHTVAHSRQLDADASCRVLPAFIPEYRQCPQAIVAIERDLDVRPSGKPMTTAEYVDLIGTDHARELLGGTGG